MIEVWSKGAMPCLKLLDSPMYYSTKIVIIENLSILVTLSIVIQYTELDS